MFFLFLCLKKGEKKTMTALQIQEFYQINKQLIESEAYSSLTAEDILLYMAYFDRLKVSIKNGWKDEQGRFFFMFKNEDAAKLARTSERGVTRSRKRLIACGLLEVERKGRDCFRLYLNDVEGQTIVNDLVKSEDLSLAKMTSQGMTDWRTSYNNNNNNNSLYTNSTSPVKETAEPKMFVDNKVNRYDTQQEVLEANFTRLGLSSKSFNLAMKIAKGNTSKLKQIKRMIFAEKKHLQTAFLAMNKEVTESDIVNQAFTFENNNWLISELENTMGYVWLEAEKNPKKANLGYLRALVCSALGKGVKEFIDNIEGADTNVVTTECLSWKFLKAHKGQDLSKVTGKPREAEKELVRKVKEQREQQVIQRQTMPDWADPNYKQPTVTPERQAELDAETERLTAKFNEQAKRLGLEPIETKPKPKPKQEESGFDPVKVDEMLNRIFG